MYCLEKTIEDVSVLNPKIMMKISMKNV